jgi:hypothetical protein
MKKKYLTRNKNNNDLNIFISKTEKSDKKIIFKTVQENQDIQKNTSKENGKKKYLNLFLQHMKGKKENKKNNSTKIIFFNKDFHNKIKNFNLNLNSSKHNQSLKSVNENLKKTMEFNKGTKIFVNNIIKIDKPKLLKLLNRDLIKIKSRNKFSLFSENDQKVDDDYIFDKSTSSRMHTDNRLNKNKYNTEDDSGKEKKTMSKKNYFLKTFVKFPKIHLNFPLELPNSITSDKQEMKDKVNLYYFRDEKLKAKLRKALYFELNSYEYNDGKYNKYKKSIENYTNYIYDIYLIPHIKNRFLYSKAIYEPRKINQILLSKNLINKEDAKGLNKFLINNITKEETEIEKMKQKEKKMKELSTSNNYLQKLCLDYEDEDFPQMTSDEVVEISDFFEKNIDYKSVTFASKKLKNVVYKESKNISKKDKGFISKKTNFMINT